MKWLTSYEEGAKLIISNVQLFMLIGSGHIAYVLSPYIRFRIWKFVWLPYCVFGLFNILNEGETNRFEKHTRTIHGFPTLKTGYLLCVRHEYQVNALNFNRQSIPIALAEFFPENSKLIAYSLTKFTNGKNKYENADHDNYCWC